ncbi:hypothetical protein A3A05_03150 [Candidatus Nomurabacteria bacterium RIFCSPLOWO2_01_FULL_41_12]|uniref:Type II secretion system protein GspH n=1 Tax=Candidatus Nomurabacteria bacterium RIFCSPLOWO2_01_FULL_41_12 TaxID=1801774 RepID=A0A1F6WV20_9BACT|nr:MAG: hypothetical protein A3A05_03150 [Candidatus Nomurabacteria bacterium RIFCSPLOWO2_01_FULL_41_12]
MLKIIKIKKNKGMSYVELIVVLSIFSVMTSVVLFNYGEFQAKVDIKNLASDVALKIVEAQKSSLSGKFPPAAQQALIASPLTWKPSYGLFINQASDDKSFFYFTDVDQNNDFNDSTCAGSGECLEKIVITKGNSISSLNVFYQDDITPYNLNDLTITFTRPNSGAVIKSSQIVPPLPAPISYVQITIASPQAVSALIKIYPSGRIQVN